MSYIFGKKALFDALKSNKDNIAVVNLMANNNLLINKLATLNIPYVAHKNQDFFKQFPIHLNHQYIVTEIKTTKVTKSHANDLKSFKKYLEDNYKELVYLTNPESIINYFHNLFDGIKQELFYVIYLDNQKK